MDPPKTEENVERHEPQATAAAALCDKLESGHEVKVPLKSILIFLFATLLSAVAFELLPDYEWSTLWRGASSSSSPPPPVPTYAVYLEGSGEGHLKHVFNVLERFGYRRTSLQSDWDLLWAYQNPYLSMADRLRNLPPHRLVNHMPGIGYITVKVELSTTGLPFMPAAFLLPTQNASFLEYAERHPNALFVEKDKHHRNIMIRRPAEINLTSTDTFVQEFLQNPLLVEGHKFDIGIYVVITSVDPMRVYMYAGDVLFRYCPVKYHPFDAANVDKYVVGADYLPTWEVPVLSEYYNRFAGSMRGAFDAYLRDQGRDPSVIWPQVEEIIWRTVMAKEPDMATSRRKYKTLRSFELVRFDMLIDDTLRVHLMEVNMSPNLSSGHFLPNALLYEQVLYNALNLVGIGSPVRDRLLEKETTEMITAECNLASDVNICHRHGCDRSCRDPACDLCLPCLTGSQYDILAQAHREHLHRSNMKRIFPVAFENPSTYDFELEASRLNLSDTNMWMSRWFYNKCLYDRSWCS